MYFGMHELLRHLIHSQETLGAAEEVLKAALTESEKADAYVLRFCLTFVTNLKLRAGAFVQRLNNELSLVNIFPIGTASANEEQQHDDILCNY